MTIFKGTDLILGTLIHLVIFFLIFGAAKQNLKIIEVPVKYCARGYGETHISRFSHGWLLLKMTMFAYRKLKSI